MNKNLLVLVLISSGIINNFFSSPLWSAETQPKPSSNRETRQPEKKSPWEALWTILSRRKEPKLSSRGSICEIAPGLQGEAKVIWSDRPLFLWRGTVPQVEIRLYTAFTDEGQKLLWSQTVTGEAQSVQYTGQPLQPGVKYEWELMIDPSKPGTRYPFQVMTASERDKISAELTALLNPLKNSGATEEEIALSRANYFAERNLWSDALGEIYSLNNPSLEFTRQAEKMVDDFCQS